MIIKKSLIFASLLIFSGILVFSVKKIREWRSPDVNWDAQISVHECIYQGPHQACAVQSMGNDFTVNYIENASTQAINPHFPIIHITTSSEHNAWVQVVYTDAGQPALQQFVDTTYNSDFYPFYSFAQDFYDAPMWGYSIFEKPLNFWHGHAYAVQADREQKTIKVIGGIRWGFELPWWKLRPKALEPQTLALADWQKDWQTLFEKAFEGYAVIS